MTVILIKRKKDHYLQKIQHTIINQIKQIKLILTNSTIYIGENLFGKASKVTAPEIEIDTETIKTGYGKYELPKGINAMSSSVELNGFYKDVFKKISNPFSEINMTVYGSLDTYTNESLTGSEQAKLILRGASKKFGLLGELEQQENLKYEIEFRISAAGLYIGNSELYYIDIPNFTYRKDGADLLAHIKKNLALN